MQQTGKLDTLQILRGIAALMVVLDHSLLAVVPYDATFAGLADFAGTIGRMGVNIFFVISGFIMVHSTRSTRHLSPTRRGRDFAWKRVIRLVPLYWTATFVQIVVGIAAGASFTLAQVVTSLSFLPNFADTGDWRMPPIVGVGWTLNYEALFYCIFGLTLLLPRRTGLVTCILVIVALAAGGMLGLRYVHGEPLHRIVAFYTFKNILFFAIGIVVALGQRLLPRLPGEWALGLTVSVMAAALGVCWFMGFGDGNAVWQSISLVTCATAVVLAASDRAPAGIWGSRLFLHVGDASFSIYLFHAMMLGWLATVAAPLLKSGLSVPFVLVVPFLCLAAGSLVNLAIEMPITRYLRRRRRDLPASARQTLPRSPVIMRSAR